MMTTKEQERKALDKIRKIVADLGDNSYIAAALDGCLDLAEQNINEDAAFSMRDRWLNAQNDAEYFHNLANMEAEENDKIQKEIDALKAERADLLHKMNVLQADALDARRDITIKTVDGDKGCRPCHKVEYFNNDGFRFINVVDKSGWTTSYKIDDLVKLVIE